MTRCYDHVMKELTGDPKVRVDSPAYRYWYERGWRYSMSDGATLDHVDSIGAPEAMYDGYMDRGIGRAKWHSLRCPKPDHDDACNRGGAR